MAHFAQIDSNNVVQQVLVVANEKITDENGIEQESLGIAFLKSAFEEETNWVQTSYNDNFRGHYANIGDTYDKETDTFIAPITETPAP